MNAQIHNGGHDVLYPALAPRRPVREAPARMGIAGISAGAEERFKSTVPAARLAKTHVPNANGLANGLGCFSLALGTAEFIAPNAIAGSLGMPESASLIRGYGAREIGAGVGILTAKTPQAKAKWMWGRVLGDVLDLATLAAGLGDSNRARPTVVGAMIAVGVITVLDTVCAMQLGEEASPDAARPSRLSGDKNV